MKETISLLNRVHEEKKEFSFRHWGKVTLDPKTKEPCETRACAGDYMVLHEPFQKQGLKPFSLTNLLPTFDGFGGLAALAAFLGISDGDAGDIFVRGCVPGHIVKRKPEWEVTAKDIADLLQTLLNIELTQENVS
jgi:hypothetical protein